MALFELIYHIAVSKWCWSSQVNNDSLNQIYSRSVGYIPQSAMHYTKLPKPQLMSFHFLLHITLVFFQSRNISKKLVSLALILWIYTPSSPTSIVTMEFEVVKDHSMNSDSERSQSEDENETPITDITQLHRAQNAQFEALFVHFMDLDIP